MDNALQIRLKKESIKTQNGAALRWAVGVGPNGFLELQLQSPTGGCNQQQTAP